MIFHGNVHEITYIAISEEKKHGDIIWFVVSIPLKNMKVSWDDYSQPDGKIKNVPNHQPVMVMSGFWKMPQNTGRF